GRPWSAMERMEVDEYRKEVEGMRSLVMPVAQALRDLAPSLREGLLDADPRNRLAASRALEEVGNSHMRLLRLTQSVPATQPEAGQQQGQIPENLKVPGSVVQRIRGERGGSAEAAISARLFVAFQKPVTEFRADDPLRELILAELPALSENLDNPD